MSQPLTVFPDPLLEVLRILRADLPTVHGSTVALGTKEPGKRDRAHQGLPYGMVATDGRTGRYPVTATARIRVAFWTVTEDAAMTLAAHALATLMAFAGDSKVRHIGAPNGPLPASDPDSGSPMAFFSLDVRLVPQLIPAP
jgi:hypothetical protein